MTVSLDFDLFLYGLRDGSQEKIFWEIQQNLDRHIDSIAAGTTDVEDLVHIIVFSSDPESFRSRALSYLDSLASQNWQNAEPQDLGKIDACLRLIFELSTKNTINELAHKLGDIATYLQLSIIDLPMLMKGLRDSFLKSEAIVNAQPQLFCQADIGRSADLLSLLVLLQVTAGTCFNLDDPGAGELLFKELMRMGPRRVRALAKDLRRSEPRNWDYAARDTDSSVREMVRRCISMAHTRKKRDRDYWRPRLIILNMLGWGRQYLLEQAMSEQDSLGLSRADLATLCGLRGFDQAFFTYFNMSYFWDKPIADVPAPETRGMATCNYWAQLLKYWNAESAKRWQNETANPESPLVSVIMTTFNPDTGLLRASLLSILRQTYRNLELVIIDDSSYAETSEAIQRVVAELRLGYPDVSVSLIRNEINQGQYISRNIALAASKGELIGVQDDDDISHPSRVQLLVNAILRSANTVAAQSLHLRVSPSSTIMVDGNQTGEVAGDSLVSFIWKREVFNRVGTFLPSKTRGDVEFRARILQTYAHPDSVALVPLPLVLMRGANGTMSSSKEYYFRSAVAAIRKMIDRKRALQITMKGYGVHWVPAPLR